jgi:hypothetical protein
LSRNARSIVAQVLEGRVFYRPQQLLRRLAEVSMVTSGFLSTSAPPLSDETSLSLLLALKEVVETNPDPRKYQ